MKLVPQKGLILCRRIEKETKKGNIVVPGDSMKTKFIWFTVLVPGSQVEDCYAAGDEVMVAEDQVNSFVYDGEEYYVVDDQFVAVKIAEEKANGSKS